ncbi:ATP-grasp domain-containing protein [Lyngbya aestuarii]|uniref:ATP-grasp domain-containing protein n=1 Tax=Lyngbya aestuarii TaxID=118322 RepID=UPI00403E0B2C
MELLEYQAKELFREIGIPVLPSQCIDNPAEIKSLQIPYPVVLKSQVPTGGRGKAGGIRCVGNTVDAIAAARTVFNLPILGRYPKVVLAESRYEAAQEIYLAVFLDDNLRRPVLLGSPQGGVNLEAVKEQMQKVVVDHEFSPFYARRLVLKMGLRGDLMESVSGVIENMYQLFLQKDLDAVEINPLGINAQGEVMALDGKITANKYALGRHSELVTLAAKIPDDNTDQSPLSCQLTELGGTDAQGNIGILCNSNCLAAATLDLIYKAKGKPARCVIIDSDANGELPSASSWPQQLHKALQLLTEAKDIKVVLINILDSTATSEEVAEFIANYLNELGTAVPASVVQGGRKRRNGVVSPENSPIQLSIHDYSESQELSSLHQVPQLVIRLVGGEFDAVKKRLPAIPVHWVNNLDRAVKKTISLAESAA